jgi:hypothetical protein
MVPDWNTQVGVNVIVGVNVKVGVAVSVGVGVSVGGIGVGVFVRVGVAVGGRNSPRLLHPISKKDKDRSKMVFNVRFGDMATL